MRSINNQQQEELFGGPEGRIPDSWVEGIKNLHRLKNLLPWLEDEEEGFL